MKDITVIMSFNIQVEDEKDMGEVTQGVTSYIADFGLLESDIDGINVNEEDY